MNTSATAPLGLILLGGHSRRMGHDKAWLRYHGLPQRDYLTSLLRLFCTEVYWSTGDTPLSDPNPDHTPILPDLLPDCGPLGGLLAAFTHRPDASWFVVPCDLPLLSAQSLKPLLTAWQQSLSSGLAADRNADRPPYPIATVLENPVDGQPEPLLGIWKPIAFPIIQRAIAASQRSPRRLLIQHGYQPVIPPDPRELLNANDPATAELARQWLAERRANG